MTAGDIIEQIERLHITLARWDDGVNFKLQRFTRGEKGEVFNASPGNLDSLWLAEVYENGLDSPATTGEGPTAECALLDLLAKSRRDARERIAAITAVSGGSNE